MMVQWFRQLSVINRLRGLALLAFVAMLALSSSLLWTSYQQRLADRQFAASQRIDLAHASVQWAYAKQQFGKLDAKQARQHTLTVLDKLQHGPTLNGYANDEVHTSMLSQTALTFGAVLLVSLLLWACIEATARDLRDTLARQNALPPLGKDPARGPSAYRQGPVPPVQAAMHKAAVQQVQHVQQAMPPIPRPGSKPATAMATPASVESADDMDAFADPNEAAAQEVRRLRMAGAI